MYRKVVEFAGVSGHTMVVPNHGNSVRSEYTIWNDSGRTVEFTMQPSGKSYKLSAGATFEGHSIELHHEMPSMTVKSTQRKYDLEKGHHKVLLGKLCQPNRIP
ncbi:MAG: hypothetical protein U0892_01375 [Pirellulales bacterium]